MSKSWVGLIAVFLIVLAARLYFTFQTPFYTTDDAYLQVRQIDSIRHGVLLWHDPLGYGGRTLVMSPVFDTVLAFFSLFLPEHLVLKLLPNIFASLLVIPAYFIAYMLTKHKPISLFSALLASFVPAFFANTFNQISSLTLALPLFFFLTYAWLKAPVHKWVITFLILLLIFVFLHPLSILFVLSIGVYILLAATEHLKPRAAEYELGLFGIFFALWAQFLLYKKLILFHGPRVIWQNLPNELLSTFYTNLTVIGAIAQIGVFPLMDGTYALYKTAFKEPRKETLMLLSITLVAAMMLWFKLIDISVGFMLLGITLAILFSQSLLLVSRFIHETKFARFALAITILTMVSALVTTAYPAYTQIQAQLRMTITQEEVHALTWLSINTASDATIIAPAQYGDYITALAKRKNVIDDFFFLQPSINERYQDIMRLYKTSFATEAVELFDKYSATHLIVPPGMKDISYADNPCFKRIWATNILIYEKDERCEVRVVA